LPEYIHGLKLDPENLDLVYLYVSNDIADDADLQEPTGIYKVKLNNLNLDNEKEEGKAENDNSQETEITV
jgi:hypothetical protein